VYIPEYHAETDLAVLHALIVAHPLGAWVTSGVDGLVANHIPFLLDTARGEHGTLCAHVARANPVWRALSSTVPSLVLFQGPESYITPSWYPSKHQHGKAVPTWNYAVVHAHGLPRVMDDAAWLHAHLERLTATHEAAQAVPWQLADAPEDYTRRMMGAIVGIEIPIDRLVGKWKVSQNRPHADKLGVVAGLVGRDDAGATAMAELVQQSMRRE
jgi:transcriptional regulator